MGRVEKREFLVSDYEKSVFLCPVCGVQTDKPRHGQRSVCFACLARLEVFGNRLSAYVLDEEPEIVACMHCGKAGIVIDCGEMYHTRCEDDRCFSAGPFTSTPEESIVAWNRQNEKYTVTHVTEVHCPLSGPTPEEWLERATRKAAARMFFTGTRWAYTPKPLDDDEKCPRL